MAPHQLLVPPSLLQLLHQSVAVFVSLLEISSSRLLLHGYSSFDFLLNVLVYECIFGMVAFGVGADEVVFVGVLVVEEHVVILR
jgi:hypothetical protein